MALLILLLLLVALFSGALWFVLKVIVGVALGVAFGLVLFAAIVAAVIGMARALGMTTIGEGIENVEQYGQLCELGCDQGQGYLFSPPMTAELFQATQLAQTP